MTFGTRLAQVTYEPRDAAYIVVGDREGRIASVKSSGGKYFLPGGGALPGETPEQTIQREIAEELALTVRIGRRIAEVVQLFRAEGRYYEMRPLFSMGNSSARPAEFLSTTFTGSAPARSIERSFMKVTPGPRTPRAPATGTG
ncbi:MAG TPA: NUDIX domain-containing protein [Blastocatellia bacterium]|nr:NUDIX domain-containing protein [Blastocatellia bacterium]